MEQEVSFETLLEKHRIVVERYINFRLPNSYDADDVIQETFCAAYVGFDKLQNKELFKPWLLSIAKNQCNMWFRKRYGRDNISLEEIGDISDASKQEDDIALEVLDLLPKQSAELLKMVMQGYKQSEIAERLEIPIGTLKVVFIMRKSSFVLCVPLNNLRCLRKVERL